MDKFDEIENENLKIDELRACFDRETSRKESLQSKASYFLGIISIIITIISTYFSICKPVFDLNSYLNIGILISLTISFIISIVSCLQIIIPKNYAHPFEFKSYNGFKDSFKIENKKFKDGLYEQYLTSTYTNHKLNDELISKLFIGRISFVCFIIMFIVMVILC